ncbi:unnamed protein product [Durusdinium trenchii]|uniref:Secreted protein n=1 Tax=Durusdinium trenchii TaxID=1381693 RepID=A0ABP0JDD4_9DINO
MHLLLACLHGLWLRRLLRHLARPRRWRAPCATACGPSWHTRAPRPGQATTCVMPKPPAGSGVSMMTAGSNALPLARSRRKIWAERLTCCTSDLLRERGEMLHSDECG